MNNLGTSSHLNAAVQCLRHALPLTKYFLEARHVPDINATNCLVLQVRHGGEAWWALICVGWGCVQGQHTCAFTPSRVLVTEVLIVCG